MYTNENDHAVFELAPVKAVLFFALGAFVCADGGGRALFLLIAAIALAVVAFLRFRRYFVCAAALFVGMAVMTGYVTFHVEPLLEQSDTTQRVSCIVTEKNSGGYPSYECTAVVSGRVTEISVYSGSEFSIGDIVTAYIGFEKIEYDSSYPAHRILLKGSVEEVVSVYSPRFSLMRSLSEFRQGLADRLALYTDDEHGALANGLLFGDTSGFPLALSHAARISGIMHFTAVSGSHFVIIMSIVLELFGRREIVRAVASGICIVLAVLFFGAEPTVIRAGLMLFLCNCGVLFSRKADTLNSLCISVIVMTICAPYVLFDVGFQMSVLGVFGVAVVGSGCNRFVARFVPVWLRPVVNMLVVSACATICVAPVSVSAFGGISLIGVFVTAALTPLFTLILTLAVVFALSGIQPIAVFISLLVKVTYHLIFFAGSNSRLWLVLDHNAAGVLALGAAVSLALAVVLSQRYSSRCIMAMSAFMAIACVFASISAQTRRKIDFVSDGDSGAAIICIRNEATVFLCGNGDGLERQIADSLLQNGIYHLRLVTASELTWSGAVSLGILNELYPTDAIVSANYADELRRLCPYAEITEADVTQISADNLTIASARSGDAACVADIVLYTGYKLSEPEYGAKLIPLYVSSRQNILPEGGINIYDTDFELNLEN